MSLWEFFWHDVRDNWDQWAIFFGMILVAVTLFLYLLWLVFA
jgi:hypothetical protein